VRRGDSSSVTSVGHFLPHVREKRPTLLSLFEKLKEHDMIKHGFKTKNYPQFQSTNKKYCKTLSNSQ
jgi:hypothetical protein